MWAVPLSLLIAPLAAAQPANPLATRLENLLSQSELLRGTPHSICVTDANGAVLYERNADLRLVPASNQKLISGLYAFERLGTRNWTGRTLIWRDQNGLYVEAYGDPSLTFARLTQAAQTLGTGGTLRLWQAFSPGVPPTWEFDDLPNRYAPSIHAFSADRAGFELFAANGQLEPLPAPLQNIQIIRGRNTGTLSVSWNPITNKLTLNGALPRARTSIETLAQSDPVAAAARALRPSATLVRLTERTTPRRQPDLTLTGSPFQTVAKDCLERSDNYFAEQLFLIAAASEGDLPPGREYTVARQRMRDFYTQTVGLSLNDISPADGSGLSRHNQITAAGLCRALNWARKRPWYSAFLLALAQPGEGTLVNRLSGLPFDGKTGTLSGVTSLSGYVGENKDNSYTVSILINNTIRPAADVRKLQDQIIATIANETGN